MKCLVKLTEINSKRGEGSLKFPRDGILNTIVAYFTNKFLQICPKFCILKLDFNPFLNSMVPMLFIWLIPVAVFALNENLLICAL